MRHNTTDPLRIKVWSAMADHFLDTETRQDIPLTAWRCVEAGLSTAEARDVWRYEVTPAVWPNAWDVAGEWAGWDPKWLVRRIERLRRRWPNQPGFYGWWVYRSRVHCMHGCWRAIERCLDALQIAGSAENSQRLAEDLAFLAHHAFDFCPRDLADLEPSRRTGIRRLYPQLFRTVMAPALIVGGKAADRRVRAALRA